ncbi:DUF4032 domain-containing protein [Actinomycetaceae bacterium WB03_NA08]|uniref:DUF4032 domain-containing protein n=1 Tax=Scrofimicrobium canadense TaxID=2652290 RepID=A0A6N7W251_9ACTO|nr:DUF4032 domain-containing protein [Scrofimicrobium canadense]MSS83365.1 DUF4032 domain-containing protein [Scrofimicrobium canadense]
MPNSLQITTANVDPALLDLPWEVPLEEWPEDILAALPRGISRHIVRFVNLSGRVIAVKEIGETVAHHEYELLRDLSRLSAPSVQPTAVITGRTDKNGEELNGVLVTEHLTFSLPYRALFRQNMSPETATRLIDALAVLLVRLHLLGFYWGDVSLSNTLFRRDAGAFSAYLVDAETGELHAKLTDGQRAYDVDLARVNIIGELMDLQAGGYMGEDADVIEIGNRIVERYNLLWDELTAPQLIEGGKKWKVAERIERLNALGFSVGELTMNAEGTDLLIQPKVVDAGHYHRQIMRLTGMDVGEAQARRMLDDLETYRTLKGLKDQPIEVTAHQWMQNVFQPAIDAIPPELMKKLEPAQVFHEILDHRWFLAKERQADVPRKEAVQSYIDNVLKEKQDEAVFLDLDPLDDLSEE